jgi:hypothetical protein
VCEQKKIVYLLTLVISLINYLLSFKVTLRWLCQELSLTANAAKQYAYSYVILSYSFISGYLITCAQITSSYFASYPLIYLSQYIKYINFSYYFCYLTNEPLFTRFYAYSIYILNHYHLNRLLFAYAESKKDAIHVTYFVSGYSTQEKCHVIKVVPKSNLKGM